MNIFKVMASGNKRFPEELMSAVLAWLLQPTMEHGLGVKFLEKFIAELSIGDIDISHRLRDVSDEKICCALEYNVSGRRIDIVYFIDEYVIAIENKIYDPSVDEDQPKEEYENLLKEVEAGNGKGRKATKIIFVYLVPTISKKVEKAYDKLLPFVKNDHRSAIIVWEKISSIIEDLLSDEATGRVEPIPEYTKHTLKALRMFIATDFRGYDYEKPERNPTNLPRLDLKNLKGKAKGFVGVGDGIAGLLRMDVGDIGTRKYNYDEEENCGRQQYIPLKDFISLAEWRISGTLLPEDYEWQKQSLDSRLIYIVVSQTPNSRVFVGIQGGEKALSEMADTEIDSKRWQIMSSSEPPTKEWISGKKYKEIYETKFPTRRDSDSGK